MQAVMLTRHRDNLLDARLQVRNRLKAGMRTAAVNASSLSRKSC
jgi:hypothetical protein